MSAVFARTKYCLPWLFHRLVSFQLLLEYLSLGATCPYVTPDLNEPPPMELSVPTVIDRPKNCPSSFEKQSLFAEPVTSENVINTGMHEDQVPSFGFLEGEDEMLDRNKHCTLSDLADVALREASVQATEGSAPESISSELVPCRFLNSETIKYWQRKMKSGYPRCKLPDDVLMSVGIKGYTEFRRRHVVIPKAPETEHRATRDLAARLMGNDELLRLGLTKDKDQLLKELAQKWFGNEPELGWTGKERAILFGLDHMLKVAVYFIRLLYEMHRPVLLKDETTLNNVQRKSFAAISTFLKGVDRHVINASKLPSSCNVGKGATMRLVKSLRKGDRIDRGERLAMAWQATEYCLVNKFKKLDRLLARESEHINRFYKQAVADTTVARASRLSDTPIDPQCQVTIKKPFFLSSQAANR